MDLRYSTLAPSKNEKEHDAEITLDMFCELNKKAEKRWRKLGGFKLISLVVAGKFFVNVEQVYEAAA